MMSASPLRIALRIPGGWFVQHNELRTLDPDAMPDDDPEWASLTQDLALIVDERRGYTVSVGWAPEESPAGRFVATVVADRDWQRPVASFTTRKIVDLAAQLERWLEVPPELPTPRLIERLSDPRPEVRTRAATLLCHRDAFEAIDPLRDTAGRERDMNVADHLLDAMRRLIHARKARPQEPSRG